MFSRNLKCLYLKSIKRIKGFLLGEKYREFLIFLFFFFIASAFWLLQTLNYDYETEFSIPLKLKDVPANVMLTAELPSELVVRVKDKGTVLLNYMLAKTFFPIVLNFSDYKGVNNHVRINTSELEKQILSQLNVSTRILSVKPVVLEYIYSTGKSKLVPVRLLGKIGLARQYYISDTVFSPDSVLVYAPNAILDTITVAYTQQLLLDNISDTLKRQVALNRVRGAKFIPNSVELTLPVDIYTEKTVDVPIYGINFPADKVLRTFPSKVQVTFQVGLRDFRNMTANDFVLNVSYEELIHLGSEKYTVKLKTIPHGVTRVHISPAQVDFLIEQLSPSNEY